MKQNYVLALAGVLALMAGGCSPRTMNIDGLAGKWNVIQVNGARVNPAPGETGPYIAFDVLNGRATANGGCNQLMCSFNKNLPAGNLTFSKVAGTMMACPDMSLEDNIKNALENTTGYVALKNNEVALTCGGRKVLVLRKGYQDYSVSTLQGKWNITELDGKEIKPDPAEPRTVTFDAGGNYFCETGCNNMSGDFTTDYTAITFQSPMSTRMACPDMSTEQALAGVLPQITSYSRLADGSLGFYNANNDMLLRLGR